MLMSEYDYETDIAVQRQEAAEEACEKMESSYEKYLEIKNRLK